jgi:hypothetical protein
VVTETEADMKPPCEGEVVELRRGLQGVARTGEKRLGPGRPRALLETGRWHRPKRTGPPMALEESDQPVVLGGRESRLQGEGADGCA